MKKGQIFTGVVEKIKFPNKAVVTCEEGTAVVKNALDILLNEVNMIISQSCEGEDPDTCDPHASHGCGGNCGSCGGCG